MVGAGFIAFTILNSILKLGAKLTHRRDRAADPAAYDRRTGAEIVEGWMKRHGVRSEPVRKLQAIEDVERP